MNSLPCSLLSRLPKLRLGDLDPQPATRLECKHRSVGGLLDRTDHRALRAHHQTFDPDDTGALPFEETPMNGNVPGARDLAVFQDTGLTDGPFGTFAEFDRTVLEAAVDVDHGVLAEFECGVAQHVTAPEVAGRGGFDFPGSRQKHRDLFAVRALATIALRARVDRSRDDRYQVEAVEDGPVQLGP